MDDITTFSGNPLEVEDPLHRLILDIPHDPVLLNEEARQAQKESETEHHGHDYSPFLNSGFGAKVHSEIAHQLFFDYCQHSNEDSFQQDHPATTTTASPTVHSPSGLTIEDFLTARLEHRHRIEEEGDEISATANTLLLSEQGTDSQYDPFLESIFSVATMSQLQSTVDLLSGRFPLLSDDSDDQQQSERSHHSSGSRSTFEETIAAPVDKSSNGNTKSSARERTDTIAGIPASQVDPSRVWQTAVKIGDHCTSDVGVTVKTRLDDPSELFPDRLFSSLKYELRVTVSCSEDMPFLHSKCVVVEADTMQEVRNNDTDKDPVLKGIAEAALTRPASRECAHNKDTLQGTLKVQISNNLSHHKRSSQYRLEIRLYLPNDLDHAVMVKRSPMFKVFARRPNKPKHLRNRKNKRKTEMSYAKELSENDDENSSARNVDKRKDHLSKKPKLRHNSQMILSKATNQTPLLDLFSEKLDALFETVNRLDMEEREKALQLMLSRCLDLSPPSNDTGNE